MAIVIVAWVCFFSLSKCLWFVVSGGAVVIVGVTHASKDKKVPHNAQRR